jgi:hypothetical protein
MAFFLRLFQNWNSCFLETWMLIYPSKQVCLEHTRTIFYIPKKDLSNGVLHAPIKYHFTLILRGFVVRSQIGNLTPNLSFDHNSCILGLNE